MNGKAVWVSLVVAGAGIAFLVADQLVPWTPALVDSATYRSFVNFCGKLAAEREAGADIKLAAKKLARHVYSAELSRGTLQVNGGFAPSAQFEFVMSQRRLFTRRELKVQLNSQLDGLPVSRRLSVN